MPMDKKMKYTLWWVAIVAPIVWGFIDIVFREVSVEKVIDQSVTIWMTILTVAVVYSINKSRNA